MTKRNMNITKIMAATLGMSVFHTHRKARRYYDDKGDVVPESWMPDEDCIIIRHRTLESLEKYLQTNAHKYNRTGISQRLENEKNNKRSLTKKIILVAMKIPKEFKEMKVIAANGIELQMINEREDTNFKYYEILADGVEITTVLEKSTGKQYILLNENYAVALGYPSVEDMLGNDRSLDELNELSANVGRWPFITEEEIKKGGKSNGTY